MRRRQVYYEAQEFRKLIEKISTTDKKYTIAQIVYRTTDNEEYVKGHIPGAILLGVDQIEDTTGNNSYNLHSPPKIEEMLLQSGIDADTVLFLYGEPLETARFAFACIYSGVRNVKILNGGISAWKLCGGTVEAGEERKHSPKFHFGSVSSLNSRYVLSREEVERRISDRVNFRLISVRSQEEWLGRASGYSYIEQSGEIAGAVWGKGSKTKDDMSDFIDEFGCLRRFDQILHVWEDCDFGLNQQLSFYCGTGWRACVAFLVLYQEGYDNISIYDGGWYEWIRHNNALIQMGDPSDRQVIVSLH